MRVFAGQGGGYKKPYSGNKEGGYKSSSSQEGGYKSGGSY